MRKTAPHNEPHPYPKKVLILCMLTTLGAFTILSMLSYQAFLDIKETWERDFKIKDLQAQITHYDEVLTMSARMAALTLDLSWEDRYLRYEPLLNQAIKEITALVPNAYEIAAAKDTDAANQRLVAMEVEAFTLVKTGERDLAVANLLGPAYAADKEHYAKGMRAVDSFIAKQQSDYRASAESRALFIAFGALAVLPALLYGWLLVFRTMNQWRNAVTVLNQTLEQRVEDKTIDLRRMNERLEQEIRTRQAAESEREASRAAMISTSKMAAVGEMASGIAHEVNNPLAVIAGRADQIQHLLSSSPPDVDRAITFAAIIAATTVRISSIITSLKSLSRNAEQDPSTSCAVRDVVNDALTLCAERFKHMGIALRVSGPTPDAFIAARPVQVSQVLLNLLNNAFDAVEPLDEKWVEVAWKRCAKTVQITVTDSGRGIPPEIRSSIMQPFFTTKPVGKGTGLGLSVSKSLIEGQGGTFALDLAHPHTRFVITLAEPLSHDSSTI